MHREKTEWARMDLKTVFCFLWTQCTRTTHLFTFTFTLVGEIEFFPIHLVFLMFI